MAMGVCNKFPVFVVQCVRFGYWRGHIAEFSMYENILKTFIFSICGDDPIWYKWGVCVLSCGEVVFECMLQWACSM